MSNISKELTLFFSVGFKRVVCLFVLSRIIYWEDLVKDKDLVSPKCGLQAGSFSRC